jgi:hypothetical protein
VIPVVRSVSGGRKRTANRYNPADAIFSAANYLAANGASHDLRQAIFACNHVSVGQPIAVMGHTGDAASLGHGHIEIGSSSGGGDPLNHHGATAWTATGDAMRHLLVELSAQYGIRNS